MRKILFVVLGIVIIVGSFMFSSYLINNKPKPPQKKNKIDLPKVKVANLAMHAESVKFKERGRVYSFQEMPLSAQVGGKILEGKQLLKVGVRFKKGDLLFKIYNDDFEAALQSQRSKFLQVLSSVLPDLKVDYPNVFNKWYNYFNSIDIQKNLTDLPAISNDTLKVFLASRGVLSSYYGIKQSQINLTKYNVYAPFNGTFKKVNLLPGSVTNPGAQVATIIRTDYLESQFNIPSKYVSFLHVGESVDMQAEGNVNVYGKISRIALFVDDKTQAVPVYVSIKGNEVSKVIAGQFIDGAFETKQKFDVINIPREAMVNRLYIYTVVSGKLKKVKVNIVSVLSDYVLVSDLPDNTQVVIESLINLKQGDEVEVIKNNFDKR